MFCLRGSKEERDHVENIYVAQVGVIEPGRVNQNDTTSVQVKDIPRLHGARARFQPSTDTELGPAGEIDELYELQPGRMISFLGTRIVMRSGTHGRFTASSRTHDTVASRRLTGDVAIRQEVRGRLKVSRGSNEISRKTHAMCTSEVSECPGGDEPSTAA